MADISAATSGDAAILSKLIVHFHAQALDDAQKEPALDAIGRMLEAGFIDIDNELASADRP